MEGICISNLNDASQEEIMSYETELNALFERWRDTNRHVAKNFIADGIIDPELWCESDLKVMFLLKEAYCSKEWKGHQNQTLDLCQHIRDWGGPKYKIWHTVAAWAYGLQKMHEDPDSKIYSFPSDDEKEETRKALFSSAVVNVKKSSGESSSNDDDLYEYVKSDWYYVLEQIKLIDPQIIVCGGTWWNVIRKHVIESEGKKYFEELKVSEWVYEYSGYFFVDFWHPANQYPNKLNYYSLCAAVQMSGIFGQDCRR